MIQRYIKLLDLYKQAPSKETVKVAKSMLLEAKVELDRIYINNEDDADITRYISELDYYIYEHCAGIQDC